MTESTEKLHAMMSNDGQALRNSGALPIAIVMISLNEAHNMPCILENIKDFATEIFLIDSYSTDETVNIALKYGVYVVQRKFRGFGDQWNFAMSELPITAPWTMKLDPDERLTDELKQSICEIIKKNSANAFTVRRRLWFMSQPLPVIQTILRGWKTGSCRFSDVLVNEHPLVEHQAVNAVGFLEHHDSPDLHHWVEKQNRYTTAEAIIRFRKLPMAANPKLFGTKFERRIWLKKFFFRIPFRYSLYFFYNLIVVRVWSTGSAGFAWARLRVWVRRMIEDKLNEMKISEQEITLPSAKLGVPNPHVVQKD
jgi:glycosyltransferase involved in cell wall biosynthesis